MQVQHINLMPLLPEPTRREVSDHRAASPFSGALHALGQQANVRVHLYFGDEYDVHAVFLRPTQICTRRQPSRPKERNSARVSASIHQVSAP